MRNYRILVWVALSWGGLLTSAYAQDKTYVVSFKDSGVPTVKAGSVRDDRVAQDPHGWANVGERVVGHVQTIEKRYGIKAEAAFGHVFKGMVVRMTPAQRDALARDPSVDRIEEERVVKPQFSFSGLVSAVTQKTTTVVNTVVKKVSNTASQPVVNKAAATINKATQAVVNATNKSPQIQEVVKVVSNTLLPPDKGEDSPPAPAMPATGQTIPWGIQQTQATVSYTLAGNGSGSVNGVRVYILDSGVRASADLNIVKHVNFSGDGKNYDCAGHGTHVAGTVGAIDNAGLVVGMAPGVPIYDVKVIGGCSMKSGSEYTVTDALYASTALFRGLEWVAANAVAPAVVNMSLGVNFDIVGSQLMDSALRAVTAKGVLVVLAAGNSARNACEIPMARLGGGNVPGLMTVAAHDKEGREASFSNFGNCVDLWAPGVDIASLSFSGGTVDFSGTSMAAPHVAGAAALYWARNPTATSSSVVSALKGMVVATGASSKDGRAIKRLNSNIQ